MKNLEGQGTLGIPRTDIVNKMREAIARFVIDSDERDSLTGDEMNSIARLAEVVISMPSSIYIGE